ncbi:hypothetical protein ACFQRL_00670 [Microbacterium fluvii]|uniref:Uncharacterized protein n=1 Tax=Microbacterium fluvii TaxID=415215 RepID=A0ABW2H7X0_9MICO|nr:hypothetical protein [Microbacterium fluvii]MCU4671099.1 hypothetical protein [Microbacterium fluvii]
MSIEYSIELDHRLWMPVPLSFPWNDYESPERWAADIAHDLLQGLGAPPEVQQALEDTALHHALVAPPLPEAIERFWRRPEAGAPDRLVHLYALETDAFAAEELVEISRVGIGGLVQTVTVLEETGFDVALRVVLLLEVGESPIAVVRLIGTGGGGALMLEQIDADLGAVAALEPDLEALLRSIRVRPGSDATAD